MGKIDNFNDCIQSISDMISFMLTIQVYDNRVNEITTTLHQVRDCFKSIENVTKYVVQSDVDYVDENDRISTVYLKHEFRLINDENRLDTREVASIYDLDLKHNKLCLYRLDAFRESSEYFSDNANVSHETIFIFSDYDMKCIRVDDKQLNDDFLVDIEMLCIDLNFSMYNKSITQLM